MTKVNILALHGQLRNFNQAIQTIRQVCNLSKLFLINWEESSNPLAHPCLQVGEARAWCSPLSMSI